MNILYIAHESRMGGANMSLLGMIDQMSAENHIYAAVPIKEGFLVDELRKRKIPVFYQHSFWWTIAPGSGQTSTLFRKWVYKILVLHNYVCALRLRKVVKQYSIDIIHTNSGVINTGGILSAMMHVPHVWHLREFGQKDFGFIGAWNYGRINRFMERHSDRVIAISEAVKSEYKKRISADLIRVVYNGVGEENLYEKKQEERNAEAVQFLISGRLSGEKGQEEAVKAVALLAERGYRNMHLFVAGPGSTDSLCRSVAQNHIDEYVSFLGYRTDLHLLRREMDVELVCSRCEAFGRVTAEAMMCSNPVIGSDSGGTPELIRDGVTGYLYRQGSAEDLADKMSRFLEHPETIQSMGRCAYQDAKEKFSSKVNAENIMEIYQELIYNKNRALEKE